MLSAFCCACRAKIMCSFKGSSPLKAAQRDMKCDICGSYRGYDQKHSWLYRRRVTIRR